MSDLIRRQDVIEEIKQFSTDNIRLRNGLMELANHMELIPSAQAVEVVRCKDCKHWDGVPADETQDHECHLFDGNEEKIRIATPSYWFCPMGERRSE